MFLFSGFGRSSVATLRSNLSFQFVRLNTGRKGIQLGLKTSSWNISYLDKTPQRVTAQDGMEARGREAGGPHPPPPEPRIEKKKPTRLFIDQRGSHTS